MKEVAMQKIVRFENRSGDELTGTLHRPDVGEPRAFALFAHCFTCTRNIKAAVHIAEALSGAGIATLRFDFTGLGQSEGEFADTHFSSNVEDLVDAADFLREEYRAPEILVGHSLGGTTCLAAAPRIDEVRAVATIGSPAEDGAAVVTGRMADDFRVSINANGHRLRGDEPVEHGGAGGGPNPYDLLAAALASCTVMTLNMYARHKKLPLDLVEAHVRHEKIHAKDCEDCETREGKIDRFERTLVVTGDLDEKQRQRLLEIADKCPVHRSLQSEIRIDSRLQD
jgi:uncharacterized OsmC-like protein